VRLASGLGIAQPSLGAGFELDAIAACVIGGAVLGDIGIANEGVSWRRRARSGRGERAQCRTR